MNQTKNLLQLPYARVLIPQEGNSYHAEILEFPGCFAQGENPSEAYSNLEKAAESWINSSLAQGQQIPEPYNNVTYSGHIALRLPRSIHRQAAQLAERDDTSLNTFLVSAVSAKVGADDLYKKLADHLDRRIVQATYYAACAVATYQQEMTKNHLVQRVYFDKQFTTGDSPKPLALTSNRR